ncbi:MAG: hypothetical protein J1F10_04975 [Muribaculaceae bacterium]|nr:hypothetical protein [Muribaculaceae bacterium]
MTLFIFNPDTDLALSQDVANFTAPPHAAQIAHDLCTLSYFLAEDDDCILVHNMLQKTWVNDMNHRLHRRVTGVTESEISQVEITRVCPWGWNRSIKNYLMRIGIAETILPTDVELSRIRHAANRERTIDIIRLLCNISADSSYFNTIYAECPTVCVNIPQIKSFIEAHQGTVLKAPWSSSGRGIYIPNSPNERPMEQWSRGIIKRQGAIIAEPLYNRVLDFAMEFRVCRGNTTHFAGYSVFHNDTHNSFEYGIVADDNTLEQIILNESNTTHALLTHISSQLCKIIHNLVGEIYDGFVGVDMMVCSDSNGNRFINPCIELNMRCTMGVLANRIAQYCTDLGAKHSESLPSKRKFMVKYYPTTDKYIAATEHIAANGGIILNAINNDTHFMACVL